jgi:hypothetical protein
MFSPTVIDQHGDEQPGADVFGAGNEDGDHWVRCPHGQPGDQLWVRETFFAFGRWETRFSAEKGRDEWHFVDMTLESGQRYLFEAPEGWRRKQRAAGGATPSWWRRPALFMPRAASRITLEITEVRVQRLQEISEADAVAEGIAELVPTPKRAEGLTPAALAFAAAATVEQMPRASRRAFLGGALAAALGFAASRSRPWEVLQARMTRAPSPQQLYALLWESINGAGSWGANPWVWALTFRVLPAGRA